MLSVAKGLSIQAHPDIDWAKILHKKNPEVYKDDNHKPEMALAVTEFEAVCGFVGIEVPFIFVDLLQFNLCMSVIPCIVFRRCFTLSCYPKVAH